MNRLNDGDFIFFKDVVSGWGDKWINIIEMGNVGPETDNEFRELIVNFFIPKHGKRNPYPRNKPLWNSLVVFGIDKNLVAFLRQKFRERFNVVLFSPGCPIKVMD